MSYRDTGTGYRGVSYGLGGMGLLAFFLLLRMCMTVASLTPDTSPAAVEKELLSESDAGPLFQTLKRTYPDEFDLIKKDISDRATAGESKAEIRAAVRDDGLRAVKRHRLDMLQAPHAPFSAYRTAEIAVIEALRKADTRLCAAYVMHGSVGPDLGENFPRKMSLEFQQRIWEAYAAGRDEPVHRVIKKPGPADIRAILAGMTAYGVSQQQIRTFSTPNAMQRATPDDQCWIGRGFLRAINDLPGDRADSAYAFIAQQAPQ